MISTSGHHECNNISLLTHLYSPI
uniref:Uncharacterized protein n=1 Tax=Arundo donax TaxID=35708 RepID=A0A0A9C8F5_ARUDO